MLKKAELDSGSEASSVRDDTTEDTDVDDVDDKQDEDDEEDEKKLEKARAAKGSYVVWNNGYFTCRNHPAYPDIKLTMHHVWAKPGLMRYGDMSKARKISDFSTTNDPYLAETVCRAWMLYRSSQHNFLKKKSRMQWWRSELAELQTRIANLGQPKGTTGHVNPRAICQVLVWVPGLPGPISI